MNKQFLKVGLVTLMAGMYSAGASAAGPINASADATLVTAVTVTPGTAMNFGTFLNPAAQTVTLSAAGPTTRSSTTPANLLGTSESSADFLIGGTTGATVLVTISGATVNLSNGANTISFTPNTTTSFGAANTVVLTGAAATDTVYVGGSVTTTGLEPAGTYTNAAAYTITADYQ